MVTEIITETMFAALAALLPALLAAPAGPDAGPAVGQQVPAFEARDQHGERRTFESLRGPEGLLLVFFRSADW